MKKIHKLSMVAALVSASFGAQAAITNIDGQAGGGLVPWALLSSGTLNVAITNLATPNLNVNSVAINTSFANRVEVSVAHNMLGIGGMSNPSNVDNYGIKVKLNDMGDAMPQFAIGAVYKHASGTLVDALASKTGALGLGVSTSSTDLYVTASKIVNMGKTVLFNVAVRGSKANELGFLGFGGGNATGAKTGYSVLPEVSAEIFAAENVILGAEYRAQADNSVAATAGALHTNAAYDLHIVYVANKNLALTAAYTNLGVVAPGVLGSGKQNGLLVQGQVSF